MRIVCLALAIASSLASCNDSQTPTAPSSLVSTTSPNPQPAPAPPGRVRGYVYDSAWRTLSGALVEVVEGPASGLSTLTNSDGSFAISGEFNTESRLRASRDGYLAATGTPVPLCATCVPGHYLHFTLAVLGATVDMAGRYWLTFVADSACSALPDNLRRRRYDVTMTASADPRFPAGTVFELAPEAAAFLDNSARIPLHAAGDYVSFSLGDFHGQPGLVEQLADNTYLAFAGLAPLTVGSPPASTISAAFDGQIDYCAGTAAMGRFYDCPATRPSAHVVCESKNHRMILERK